MQRGQHYTTLQRISITATITETVPGNRWQTMRICRSVDLPEGTTIEIVDSYAMAPGSDVVPEVRVRVTDSPKETLVNLVGYMPMGVTVDRGDLTPAA